MTSQMAREIDEAGAVVARLLRMPEIAAIARDIAGRRPRFVVICGRGSSGHVGVALRYLIETKLGLVAAAAAPSVVTAYGRSPAMQDALFVVISQSGRSPDLVASAQAAARSGARVLAIVNDAASPVAKAAHLVLAVGAGPELSVAATKSVIACMAGAAALVARIADDRVLDAALARVPERLTQAKALDWAEWRGALIKARASYVTARGYALGSAREIALKVAEILRLPSLAYSAAELRHGPRAAITPDTPVLALRQADETAAVVDGLAAELRGGGVPVFLHGGSNGWIGDDHPAVDPIVMLAPAYRAIEAAARAKGFDPDRPPHLSKVTETL